MELRNRETGAVITDAEFRQAHPNTSFPAQLTPDIVEGFGFDPVFEGPQATVIPPYQYSQRDGVIEIDGKWFTHFIAGPIFHDYVDEQGVVHTASEQYEAYCFRVDSEQGDVVRAKRNTLLAESDWTQLIDSPLIPEQKTAWANYRQELRDVTTQAGFPWEVTWPTEP